MCNRIPQSKYCQVISLKQREGEGTKRERVKREGKGNGKGEREGKEKERETARERERKRKGGIKGKERGERVERLQVAHTSSSE